MSSFFDPATTPSESPEDGQEELGADENEELEQEESEELEDEQPEEEQEEEEEEQDEEDSEEEEEEGPEDDGQPENLLAGKFKTPAELEEAYKQLQSAFTRARMQKQAPPAQQQQQPPQIAGLDLADADAVIEAFQQDPTKTIASILQVQRAAEIQQQQFYQGVEEVGKQYEEHLQTEEQVTAYFDKVEEVCKEMGIPSKFPSPRVLKLVAKELYGELEKPKQKPTSVIYNEAKKAARQEAAESRKKAGLSAPKGAKPAEKPKSVEDLVREGIVNAGRSGGMFS